MRCDACRCNGAWGGGVFVSPAPAYADGYVDGTGNNIYYGFKTDASYSEARFHIEVDYYDTLAHAKAGEEKGKDPLGKFVRVHYLSNCNKDGGTADDWRFRPMWWFGVPKGLQNVQDITYTRVEKLTQNGKKQPFTPAGSSQFKFTNTDGYSQVSQKKYNKPEEWNNISNFYFKDSKVLASKGWKQLLGLNGGKYDTVGNTETQWQDYQNETAGLQGIFVDWESAGQRFYDMTYVGEMTDDAWKKRDENPLRFAAGVYRFAGNWHYAVGQKHDTPKIADHLKLVYPEVTKVKNPSNVTSTEQETIKGKIADANKDTKHYSELVDKVEVSDKGVATITFKDKTIRTIPASILVAKDETDKDKYKPVMPDRTPVVKPSKLTDEDKKTVIAAFKKANANNKGFNDNVKADPDGIKFDEKGEKLVITYKDDSKLEIPASELVYQGATIADWAPYVVPDTMEVENLKQLKPEEITKIVNAFDAANTGITPYDEAKTAHNNTAPVTVNQTTGDATITWKDGSTTVIDAWQFLKEKKKTPAPQPPVPKPAEEKKTFTVEFSDSNKKVVPNFDPFNASSANETTKSAVKAVKKQFTALKAKDPDGKDVTITDVEFDFDNGKVIFKAGESYKDQSYPMPLLFKKGSTGTQNPTQQTPTSKTYTESDNNKNTYTYFVTKTQISEAKVSDVTAQEAVKALKQFVKDNYTGWTEQDLEHVTSNVAISTSWKAKKGTKNLEPYNNGNGRITSISVNTNNNGLTVTGYRYADQEDAEIDASTDGPLFTISANDLYTPNSGSQTPTDNTIDQLKTLARQLRDQRKNAGELADADITTLKATDTDINGMTDEKALRELIKKIADYQKPKPVEYKYNFEKLTLDHDGDLTDADYKKIVVEQFLKKNYTTTDWSNLENAYSKSATVLSGSNANTYGLTPVASGTSGLNIYTGDRQAGGVTSVVVDSNTGDLVVRGWKAGTTSANAEELIRIKKADLFTPKSKDQNPALTPEQLQQMKDDAKKIIDKNPYLTPDQKKKFKSDIDNATDQPGIQKILNDAKNQGNTNKTDPNVQQIINKNKNGGDEKDKHELDAAKEAAKKAIEALTHLSNEEKTEFKNKLNGENVKTPADVQKIVDAAKLADELKGAKDEAQKAKFVFLDHGKGGDADSSDPNHNEDAALNELLGGTPGKDSTLAALETALAKKDPAATAKEIKTALDAAKRQNAINEQNAKNAGIAKLDALLQEITSAESSLTDAQKTEEVKTKISAAKDAITKAKNTVNAATKPSQIKDALNIDATIKAAKDAINTQVTNAQKTSASDPSQTQNGKLGEEKKKAEEEIDNIPGLTKDEKDKYKEQIDDSTHSGDPEAIVNQAKKHKKIEDALKKLDEFKHLNDAQRDAFKKIIEDTDAHNHTDENGKDLGIDDIDVALANAANTDNAMARLEELKKTADDFSNGNTYKNFADKTKKDAFDAAYKAAKDVLDKADGDAKNADQVNELYNDLLKAMRAINPDAKSAGLKTDALAAEIKSDKTYKPSETDPKTPGNSVYNTSSAEKKAAFDTALSEAETALKTAEDTKNPGAKKMSAEEEATAQQAVDDALDKLIKARLALDGVDTKPLQDEIDKDSNVKNSDKYTYATTTDKKTAFDKALKDAQDLIKNLTTPSADGTTPNYGEITLDTKDNKQKALDDALAKLKAAEAALDGHAPTPAPSVDKSHLQQGINGSGDVKKSDDYNNAPSDKKQAYDHALDHANEVNNNPNATQDQVNQATEDLKKAENDLKPAPTPSVDKSGLQKEIGNEPNVKNSDEYNNAPSDKKQAYDHALDHANEVNNNPNATQDQVNQAAEDLKKAEHDLKPAPTPSVDKSGLQKEIGNEPNVKKSDDYNNAPSDKKQAYDHALDHANEVNKDPNATQDQVNQAAEDLKNAQKDLHDSATVDKSHLQSEVSDDVAFRARGSYLVADAPHKDAYNAALSEARRVLADPNATQAQVNAALSKLREAKRNILQANGLSGDEYAGDGNTGTGNTGSETGTGNAGTGAVPGGSSVVPGTVPGSGDFGFGSTGTSNAGTSNTGTNNSGVAGSGHEGDTSLGFGVNDNAPTTVDKGELNLQIQGAESDSQSANAGNAGVNSGNAGSNNAANAGNAGANNTANANNAGANAGNAGANNAANAGNAGANAGNAGANAAANNNAAVTAAVENNPAVKQADAQVAAAQAALDSALAEAKKVAADHNATQAQVDAAKRKLADARKNLADAQAHAAQVRASVRAQVLKSGKVAQLSNTGSAVSALSTFAATIAAAGAALFVSKRRGTSRHCSK
ncbi:GA module [Gardnerella sp. KA00747]|uniref:GA module n=1 Tax=Gardnerella sp. KA00747 TaxID=2749078 RepID=UPI003BABC02E